MTRAVVLFFVLFGTWLLLSGHYSPLLTGLGVVSCGFVAFIAYRMDIVDKEGHPIHLGLHTFLYMPWLLLEIVKSNLQVARLILSPSLPISPNIITVKASQKTVLGQVIYANSITLTPGTVSLSVDNNEIEVHALSKEFAEGLQSGEMDRRVATLDARHEEHGR